VKFFTDGFANSNSSWFFKGMKYFVITMIEKEKNNRRLLVRIEPTFTQLKSRKPIFSMFLD